MEKCNNVTVFILLKLSKNRNTEILCFILFLFCYIAIWIRSVLIMISITCSQLIEQPMYFFFDYLCSTSTVTLKLFDLLAERKIISYRNCMAQLFSMHFLEALKSLSSQGWPLTITWSSASPCTTPLP